MKKTVLITGANSGLGFETARKVAAHPDFSVILACRNPEKAAAAREKIVAETGNEEMVTLTVDTSSLASVRAFAEAVISSGKKIYAIVNNAGISAMGNTGVTGDGFELLFATNYLGHFLLTRLLLPCMEDSGRILNISSDMHNPPGGLSWPGADAVAHADTNDRHRYSWSKLCMIYFTQALCEELAGDGRGIIANSFNPGFMADTNFSKGSGKLRELAVKTAMPERYGKLETSSDALAALIVSDEFSSVTGAYYDRSTRTAPSSELSRDKANARELWEKSLEYTAI